MDYVVRLRNDIQPMLFEFDDNTICNITNYSDIYDIEHFEKDFNDVYRGEIRYTPLFFKRKTNANRCLKYLLKMYKLYKLEKYNG